MIKLVFLALLHLVMQKLYHWLWLNGMEKEPFKIDLWTGASVGDEADGALTRTWY